MAGAFVNKTVDFNPQCHRRSSGESRYVAKAAEAMDNYKENRAATWHNDEVQPDDTVGNYAFQRVQHTWFTPKVDLKFKLRRDDKFYAIGSRFARGLENALADQAVHDAMAARENEVWRKILPVQRDAPEHANAA